MTTVVRENVPVGLEGFRSRVRVLADWFRRSRDNWKDKYMQAKAELKKYKVRVSDVNKSRDRWKEKAQTTERELEALQEELERLRNQSSEVPSSRDEPAENGTTPEVEKRGAGEWRRRTDRAGRERTAARTALRSRDGLSVLRVCERSQHVVLGFKSTVAVPIC